MIKKEENKSNIRRKQAADTKKRLYDSAQALFNDYDFADVSVDSIIKAAGVSKGTFYVHFDSKDALLASLLSDYVNSVDMNYKNHIRSLPPDMKMYSVLLALIEKIADMLINTIGYNNMNAVYKAQLTRTIDTEAIKGYGRELYKMFSDVIGRGIQQGEFKTQLPLETISKHFVMAIRGLTYEWCIRYPDFDLKEEALTHFKILLAGIAH